MNGRWKVKQMNQSVTFSREGFGSMSQLRKLLLAHTYTHNARKRREKEKCGGVGGSEDVKMA